MDGQKSCNAVTLILTDQKSVIKSTGSQRRRTGQLLSPKHISDPWEFGKIVGMILRNVPGFSARHYAAHKLLVISPNLKTLETPRVLQSLLQAVYGTQHLVTDLTLILPG